VAENHPDRARQGASSEALVEVSQAYRRLRRFERRYGRLPGQNAGDRRPRGAFGHDGGAQGRECPDVVTRGTPWHYAGALPCLAHCCFCNGRHRIAYPARWRAPVRVDLPSQTLSPRAPDRVIRIGDTAADVQSRAGRADPA
jgi:hypothetical protein